MEENVLNTQSKYATKADIEELKSQMNRSMTELIEMLVGMQENQEAFEERIQKFNKVSSFKL